MVPNEFVDEDDFIVDGGRESVGLRQETVFGVVLDRADKGGLFFGRQRLVMCYFLEAGGKVRAMSIEM